MNVSPRTYGYLLRISISFFMSIMMSFAMLVLNLGFVENFMVLWFKSFSVAFALAVVISSLVFPLVIALLSKLVKVCDEPADLQEVTEGC
ncbi:hypothetical protein PsAD13_05512 [Pseudovibrio sp. Ad13]|uniref:DUF2798 domain-containing protein n=1 Tax=unclassified Pseudovibrio TaxID=2627060 RepID=UPI0007AEB602|nr:MULTISPECIES: DUF2798 domain-containing protein [unclassified Pseudovibrio]KZK76074.1 hypothetical protein PsAD13_05512 [Pseudovibrio sp. Ad13]KZL24070.1 hypothetical protein PsAD37_02917 [Pseudovibrio sp. Ad37]